jgi:hypothetical protein
MGFGEVGGVWGGSERVGGGGLLARGLIFLDFLNMFTGN